MTEALVVVAHPDPTSLTHHVAHTVVERLEAAEVSTQFADLHAEGFDPRFTTADRQVYQGIVSTPDDVIAEQRRLDRVDHVVLVFPVFWWSMPALLKGWIDRVFINGWAFDEHETPIVRKLDGLTMHLVMIAADDAESFERRGYDTAIATQIVTGIIGYCGAHKGITSIVHDSEGRTRDSIGREVADIAASIATDALTSTTPAAV